MKKLALGALIAFAVFGIAVAAAAGFEWWQNRSDTPTTVVGAPVTTPLDTRVYEQEAISIAQTALAADPGAFAPERIEARVLDEAYQDRQVWSDDVDSALKPIWVVVFTVADPAGGRGNFSYRAAVWVDGISGEVKQVTVDGKTKQPTTTTLHPQVQAQGWERVVAITEGRSDAWPWIVQALDVAQISFFEDLPPECDSAIGCYNPVTGAIWLTLDALRERDPYSFSAFLDDRSPSDTVLHELAHAYTRSFPQGSDLLDRFGQHYAGCSSRGLNTDRLITELLADTMVMAVTRVDMSWPFDGYGYFRSGGFTGCLVESGRPDVALVGAVYSTLFNCDSEHALNVYEDYHYPDPLSFSSSRDTDAGAVLRACYDTDDHRDDHAEKRLHERRCADGFVRSVVGSPQPGWEFGCEDFVTAQAVFLPACDQHSLACTIFVPADVECTVVTDHDSMIRPGLLDVSGECIVPTCTVGSSQGERLPGYLEHGRIGACIPIDRAERRSDSQVRPEPEQPEFVEETGISPDGTDLSALTFDIFDGGTGALSDYAGAPLVVNFFASWCPPCKREMPEFQEIFEKLDGQVAFLGLSQDQSAQDALNLVATTGVTYDVGWDLDLEVYGATGSIAMPTTAFVSPSGELLDTFAGVLDSNSLAKLIEDAFGTAASS